jgi:signal transduction histidine kinase/ligand-binding sensor domain-containing protein
MFSRPANLLMAVVWFSSSAAWADSAWSVRSWQVNDSSNGAVTGIIQSTDGYLWIATAAGLNQFDGVQFKSHSLSKELGLAKSNVRMTQRTRAGALWVAVDGAIVRFGVDQPPVVVQENVPDGRPDCMVEDATGSLWIGYHSGPLCRITGEHVTVFAAEAGIPGGANASLAIDNEGHVWFARGNAIGLIRDGAFQEIAQHSTPLSLARAKEGGLWVASGATVYKYDQEHGFKTLAKVPLNRPSSSVPMKLFEDGRGVLWVGTETGGLFQFNGSRFDNIATPQSKITCFAEDREDNLWVGTDAGFDRVSPRAVELEARETGLPLCSAISVCQAADGQIWAAMADGSLMVRDGGRWGAAPFKFSGAATCLTTDSDGAIWIGTKSQRLLRFKGGKLTTWDASKGVGFRFIVTLLAASNGDLWIGSQSSDKLQCLRGDKFIDFQLPSESARAAASVEDQKGDIWLGRAGSGGLVRIHGDKVIDETALADHKPVQSLCVTADGSLWLAIRYVGLGRYKNGELRRITLKQGFLDDNVEQIVADGRGWLWFGSNHGIFRVREQELNDLADGKIDRVQSVSHGGDEGLPPLQARMDVWPSAVRAKDGRIWMPMASGLAIVNPDNIPERSVPPLAYIQQATIDGRIISVSSDYFSRQKDVGDAQTPPLQLQPDYSRLELSFTAPTFRSPESVRFRYRLDGFSRDWNEKTGPRVQIIPRLPAGNYCFRVQAANAEGIWGEETAAVSFSVAPFFWQRWWFQTAVGLLVFGTLAWIARSVWFRRLRRQLQILEQRTALDRERTRIARDLHDDLGHALTQIVLLSDLTRHDSQDPDELESHLQHIASTARLGIKSLDETVWAINPRNDTLADLIDYLGQFVMESLRSANIKCQLDLPDRPPSLTVPTEVRHSLFLAVKETVNNVLRHAQATAVALSIALADDDMTITIADNGRGFEAAPGQPGQDGLHNISQRMRDIGGSCQMDSAPGSGTRVLLKLTLADAKPVAVTAETREPDADLCLHR